MDMKQQTAVEWLINELSKTRDYQRVINEINQKSTSVRDVIAEAKAMEKKQIIDARLSLDKSDNIWDSAIASEEAEKYYKETYE